MPERHLRPPRPAARRHQHTVLRHLCRSATPTRPAETPRPSSTRRPSPRPARPRAPGPYLEVRHVRPREHAIQPAVGDGSAVQYRDALHARTRSQPEAHAVPHHTRSQLGKLVRRITSRQHVQHAIKDRAAQPRKRRAAPLHQLEQRVIADSRARIVFRPHPRAPLCLRRAQRRVRDDRHNLLRQHVQRVAQEARRLHMPLVHRLRHCRTCHQVRPVLREQNSA